MEPNNTRPEQRTMVPVRGGFTARDAGEDMYIEGYFSVFGSPYQLWEGCEEVIAPGAFADTLGGDIRALTNHDTRLVLGRTKSGTLTLREDAVNLYRRVQRGDVDQCSFGFFIEGETRDVLEDGTVRYTINKVQLLEVSVVTFPAYEETSVSARHRAEEQVKARELAEWKAATLEKLRGA